jgi:endoglucanase
MFMIRACSVLPFLACAAGLVGCSGPSSEMPEASESEENQRLMARGGRFRGLSLFVEQDNPFADQAALWRDSDPEGAALMDDLAAVPSSLWLGDWMDDVASEVDDVLTRAAGTVPVFVLYNIPQRDCGSFSAGGSEEAAEYTAFVDQIAVGLDGRLAIVIVEPDGLALNHCLSDAQWDERTALISDAVDALTAAGAKVYLDAGDSHWIPSDDMAQRLLEAGVERAAGFALNVSHTETSEDEAAYAAELRDILGPRARYVIDTGRNGVGPTEDHEWCNPLGRKNGDRPSLWGDRDGLDAKLWVKRPGSSDGWCNGGPEAGAFWPEYARDLAL